MDENKSIVSSHADSDSIDLEHLFHQIETNRSMREVRQMEKAKKTVSLVEADSIINSSDEAAQIIYNRIMQGDITGDADDYHNISVSFSRRQQHKKAADICKKGLELWPDDIDLNADLLTYLMDSGDIASANIQADQLEKNCPDRTKWNWRAFRFLFGYYMEARPKGYLEKVEKLVEDYKTILPWDEKAYRCAADLYEHKGDINSAISILEEGISNLNAPQCALRLADIYFEQAKYEDVIRVSTLGIAYAAEPQPGIRTAYLLFLRALSKDARYLKNGALSVEEGNRIIKEYELAMKYVSAREKEIIKQRIDILQVYSGNGVITSSNE